MKPINLNTAPCVPMSSNCVIWQGDNIPCINLCHGDTVSDVVFKLATELCTIMDQLNVSNYDLTCFGINACGPNDFQALIQFLITQICELQGVTPITKDSTIGCPDCLVTVAPCFVVGNQTTMNLVDYVNMIAARVCDIIDELVIINATLINLDNRVTVLEDAIPPSFTIPSYITECQIGSLTPGTYAIDIILEAFTNDVWCPFYDATGTTAELLTSLAAECIFGTDIALASPIGVPTPMQVLYPSWNDISAGSLASTINHLWISMCDMRTYVSSLGLVVEDTNTVNLTYVSGTLTADVQDTGWWPLKGFDFYNNDPTNLIKKPQARRIGNVIHFKGQITIPLDNAGSVVSYLYKAGTDTYLGTPTGTGSGILPYQGAGGVVLSPYGSIDFNSNGTSAQSVIPIEVLPAGYVIDDLYQNPAGWKMAYRTINAGPATTVLSTLLSLVINTNGTLICSLVKNIEEGITIGSAAAYDTSHLNYIISHVVGGENVPQFKTPSNIIHSLSGGGISDLNLDFPAGLSPLIYPFSCNANDETNLGGFHLRIDGHTVFINPCGTAIPTPEPCPK